MKRREQPGDILPRQKPEASTVKQGCTSFEGGVLHTPKVVYADAPALNVGSRSCRSESYATALSVAAAKLKFLKCAALVANRTITSREGDWLAEFEASIVQRS